MKTTNREGSVKVVNALAIIHEIFDEIAPNGTLHCCEQLCENNILYTFTLNGIEATFQIKEGGKL